MLPPWNDDVKFEDFITAYFNDLEKTTSYDRFGRLGQKQHGLDVYSSSKKTVIQCKLKLISGGNDEKIRIELIDELDKDFKSFLAYNNENNLSYNRFIFASTFYSDTHISTECAKRTTDKITVEYWSWEKLKNNITDNTFKTYYSEISRILEEYYSQNSTNLFGLKNINPFKVDKSKSLIDQLKDILEYHTSEIKIQPIHLLKNNYPFKKSDDFYPYYSLFTLTTDNDELFELFESLKIENEKVSTNVPRFKKGTKISSQKLKFILEKLSEHLVYNIQHRKLHKTVNIRYSFKKPCDCIRCSFGRLDYKATFNRLLLKPKNINDKLLLAYSQYELGNYVESARGFEDVAKNAKKKKQLILYAVAEYNLSRLSIFIRSHYWGENSQTELLERLKAIEPDRLYCELKTEDNKKLLDWILNSKFYTSKRDEISRTVEKIRDHYYSQLKGGWSSNSHIWSLINNYAELETFVNGNYIIYDGFSEYSELTDNFIEGLIISHAIDENQTSRLEHFDDWLFLIMVFNGNAERILKYFNRYNLKTLKYKPTSEKGSTFIDILNNHLTNYENIIDTFEKSCEKTNRTFWEKYNSIFCNLMTLVSISEIEKDQVRIIAKHLLKYLDDTNFINHISIKYVRLFINSKGKYIDKSDLYGFLNLFFKNGKFHENNFLETVIHQIKNHHKILSIDRTTFDKLLTFAFEKCKFCNQKHEPDFIISVFNATSSSEFRSEIHKRIEAELKKQFDSNIYYLSAIYGVLTDEEEFFHLFIDSAKLTLKTTNIKSVFTGTTENRYPKVNMLLNLCYKLDSDLTQGKFDDFRDLDKYYSWLFNMGKFDYSDFNPKWTTEYQTKYYIKQFKKFPIIKDKVLEYLKDNSDYMLEKLLIELVDPSGDEEV